MKTFFQKNLIHPVATNHENGTVPPDKGELSLIIPMTSELTYFERRLNNNFQGCLAVLDPLNSLDTIIVRRYHRKVEAYDGPIPNEPTKYEILSPSGRLIYFIAEQTEYFVKSSTCFSKLETMELNIMTPTGESVMKYFVDFGCTGFCKKITTKQHNRLLGSTSRPFHILSPSLKYTTKDSKDKELFKISSKNWCCRWDTFCSPTFSNDFDISWGRGRFAKGKIHREEATDDTEDSYYAMSLFHGVDPLGKILLISGVILVDLQASQRGNNGLCKCDILTCLSQFAASICFYILFFIVVTSFVFLMVANQH